MAITFVTCFFDIGRETDASLQKFDNYFAWIERLLQVPINLYFFTSPEIHDKLQYTSRSNLKFHFIPEIPYFEHLDVIREAWTYYRTGNPKKDTPEFAAITHAKFILLCRAMRENPFGDEHYGWIDAGLLKIATNAELIPTLQSPNLIRTMMLSYTGMEEVKEEEFVKTCRYKFAGGLFVGPKDLLRVYCLRMIAEAEYHLSRGKFGLEQEYMAIIYRRHPELFDCYYGTFTDLIVNYNGLHTSYPLIRNIFIEALKYNDREEAGKVAHYVCNSNIEGIDRQAMEPFVK